MTSHIPRVQRHDLSRLRGRVFVAGDIHGCFDALAAALDELGWDAAHDRLFLLGDLVDRGPDSLGARDWLDVPRVLGNHEDMAWRAATGDPGDIGFHVDNGGQWLQALGPAMQREFAEALMDAPLAIEVLTPAGHRIGLVHADVDGDDWPAFLAALEDPADRRTREVAIWSRSRYLAVCSGEVPLIRGIDHVFFGHNIVREVGIAGNCSWIDTGAGTGTSWGRPTVIDIDAHLAALAV